MSSTPGSVHRLVRRTFTATQLRDLTGRDVGRLISISRSPFGNGPMVEANVVAIGDHVAPLFAIDESAAERILKSVRLHDPSNAAEFLAETQWAISSMREDIEERERLEKIKIDDDRSLHTHRRRSRAAGRKRAVPLDRDRRYRSVASAARQLKERLLVLTTLDRLDIEERSRFSRAHLDDAVGMLDEMLKVFKGGGRTRGNPGHGRHEKDFVQSLAANYFRLVGNPAKTRRSGSKSYQGPFERYVRAVTNSEGIVLRHDLDHLIRSATSWLRSITSPPSPSK